jgi:energy-coupling factor transporter ATP-binding protein EcfA2
VKIDITGMAIPLSSAMNQDDTSVKFTLCTGFEVIELPLPRIFGQGAKNIAIVGHTGSGKSTLMRALEAAANRSAPPEAVERSALVENDAVAKSFLFNDHHYYETPGIGDVTVTLSDRYRNVSMWFPPNIVVVVCMEGATYMHDGLPKFCEMLMDPNYEEARPQIVLVITKCLGREIEPRVLMDLKTSLNLDEDTQHFCVNSTASYVTIGGQDMTVPPTNTQELFDYLETEATEATMPENPEKSLALWHRAFAMVSIAGGLTAVGYVAYVGAAVIMLV